MAPLSLCKHALKPGVRARPDYGIAGIAGASPTASGSDGPDTRTSASAPTGLTVPPQVEEIAPPRDTRAAAKQDLQDAAAQS
jgi:hypothetical protein